jgi:plastocyanin
VSPRDRLTSCAGSAAALLAWAALAAGCGSSSSSGEATTSSSAASSGTTTAGHLRVLTTPKYVAPSQSAPVRSGTVPVAYRNIAISPDTLRVKVGAVVRWTNYDAVEHNVTSHGAGQHLASGNFGEGQTFSVRMTRPGVIHYTCTIHPATMNGTIEVVR